MQQMKCDNNVLCVREYKLEYKLEYNLEYKLQVRSYAE